MRKNLHRLFLTLGVACLVMATRGVAQDDAAKAELLVNIRYFNHGGNLQYLDVQANERLEKRMQPVKDLTLNIYLDSVGESNFVGKIITGEKGEARLVIPPALKDKWLSSSTHNFIAVSEANKKFEESTFETSLTRLKIEMDTLNDGETRSVSLKVLALEGEVWVPAKEVEVRIGVKRLGGLLLISEEESYTTDSLGEVSAEFKRDSLPGDEKRNLVLVARTEDNDTYGNVSYEMTVPWGGFYRDESEFGERTLWGKGNRAPFWLMGMAYGIIAIVWGVIVYLIIQIMRIRKIGMREDATTKSGGVQRHGSIAVP